MTLLSDTDYETLWQRLDDVQAKISALIEMPAGPITGPWFAMEDFSALAAEERYIFALLEGDY